ncbi:hypothetical protein [Aquirhabdus parva]|uniref:Uncharacterized protein n=1 Tax=Aquirhabdus parva TaxID=2283318 RepID=A0A345PAS9_9GAMM|nr:hypothetical protein [Aquirhabdus parva]AXI01442.1 hypothetical protein HYN46_00110 [Aquirhabdus parva]AXI04388.1 hypothetical protein HYN46_17025 [Aquirhabdus parva]
MRPVINLTRAVINKKLDELHINKQIQIYEDEFKAAYPLTKDLQDHCAVFLASRDDPWLDWAVLHAQGFFLVRKIDRKTKRIPKEEPVNLDLNWHD